MRLLILCFSISAFSFSAFPQWLETHQMIGKRAFAAASGGGGGSIAFLSSVAKQGNASECKTNLNTTGANLIVVTVAFYSTQPTVTDSVNGGAGNTLTLRTNIAGQAGKSIAVYDILNPSNVGASHEFTVTGGDGTLYASVYVQAFSGVTSFSGGRGALCNFPASKQPGALTGKLHVTGTANNVDGTLSVDSSFIGLLQGLNGGGTHRSGAAYKIQAGSSSENPAWSNTSSSDASVVGVSYE